MGILTCESSFSLIRSGSGSRGITATLRKQFKRKWGVDSKAEEEHVLGMWQWLLCKREDRVLIHLPPIR